MSGKIVDERSPTYCSEGCCPSHSKKQKLNFDNREEKRNIDLELAKALNTIQKLQINIDCLLEKHSDLLRENQKLLVKLAKAKSKLQLYGID